MNRPAALVVGAWALMNGLLTLGLLIAGGYWQEIGVYAIAVGLALVFALCALVSWWRHPVKSGTFRPPGGRGAPLLAAAGGLLIGLGLIYGWWFGLLAVPLCVLAAVKVVHGFRRQVAPRANGPRTGD